jgi:hypothetical protein
MKDVKTRGFLKSPFMPSLLHGFLLFVMVTI